MVHVEIIEASDNAGAAIEAMREEASKIGIHNPIVLESLLVKDPKNFGKGYGKKAFLDLLDSRKEAILIYPFSMYYPSEDAAYAGRIKLDSMEAMEEGIKFLREKFYKPLIRASGREFLELETEGGTKVLLVK